MPPSYPETYFPVLVQVVIAVVVAAALVAISFLLGKRVRNRVKDSPYESGIAPTGSGRERFSVKFYLVAIVFILFDIEAVFLYPWAVVYRGLKMFGFFDIWREGALDWSQDAAEGSPYDAEGAKVTKRNAA